MNRQFDDQTEAALIASLQSGQYNLLLGSGVSLDSTNSKRTTLAGAEALRVELCALKNAKPNSTLQRAFSLLAPGEVKTQITERYSGCTPGPSILKLPTFVWRRVFTFNVDDALEASYARAGALQKATSLNYTEAYVEARDLTELPIVHLHGWVSKPEDGYVFSISEYVRQANPINPWMVVLTQFLKTEPFIIAGTSLEEYDLEYYIAHRTPISARSDRGPSILVEPFPDVATARDCARYGLRLFRGTMEEFTSYLEAITPKRKSVFELLPASTTSLFPEGTPKTLVAAFAADFEPVPENFVDDGSSRFLYGHPPSWADLDKQTDVSRSITTDLVQAIRKNWEAATKASRLFLLLDEAGGGKTTILRRVAKEFTDEGLRVLVCSALSRVDAQSTAGAIDLIEGQLVVVIDNFADQAWSMTDTIRRVKKRDIVFVAAERVYRWNYLRQALAGLPYAILEGKPLTNSEAKSLISLYQQTGLVGAKEALNAKGGFDQKILTDPIAVACCRILNDFRPLERIVQSVVEAATDIAQARYFIAALAHYCLRGGVRYEILASICGRDGWDDQFETGSPLALAYFEGSSRSFVVPLNGSIGSRALEHVAKNNRKQLLEAFVSLANAIAPRVNRKAIINRTPEARLAGRLFDYDQVVMELLKEDAPTLYERTKRAWQWNSRYWEQVALMHLHKFQSSIVQSERTSAIALAVGHARHAVAIERHPLTMTTLAKILMSQLGQPNIGPVANYDEAFMLLTETIEREQQYWSRVNAHAFVGLFRGTKDYMALGGIPTVQQRDKLRALVQQASDLFVGDKYIEEEIGLVKVLIG